MDGQIDGLEAANRNGRYYGGKTDRLSQGEMEIHPERDCDETGRDKREKLRKQTQSLEEKDSVINSCSSSPLMQHTSNNAVHLAA